MIALKLVFQSLAGVGAFVGCLGGGYYVINNEADDFYLVSSSSNTDSPTTTMWNNAADASEKADMKDLKNKNYTCKSVVLASEIEQEDKNCEIYSLTFDSTNKHLDLSNIQEFVADQNKPSTHVNKTKSKTEFTTKKLFLLKASKKLFLSWTFDGTKQIKLLPSKPTTADASKSYTTVNVLAKVSKKSEEAKTNLLIAKATTSSVELANAVDSSTTSTFKCKTILEQESSDCSFAALSEVSNSPNKGFNFSSTTITASHNATFPITANSYYLIKWEAAKKHNYKDLIKSTITFVDSTTNSKEKNADLIIESALLSIPNTSSASIQKAIILN